MPPKSVDICDDPDIKSEFPDEPAVLEPETPESSFDLEDAFIIGGMIAGQAYEGGLKRTNEKETKQMRNPIQI